MPHSTSGLTRHHRKPRSIGGTSEPRNISYVSGAQHSAWHALFHNWTAEEIAATINRVFLDPDYEFIAIPKEELCESLRLLSGSSSRSR